MPLRGKNWHIIGKIYHFNQSYIVSGPGQGWGWLGLGGCCTLPVGLRPCSGGNSRWSPRNLKPFANDSRGYRGPNKRGLFSGLHFGPLRDWPYCPTIGKLDTALSNHWTVGHSTVQPWTVGHSTVQPLNSFAHFLTYLGYFRRMLLAQIVQRKANCPIALLAALSN